MLTPRDLDQGAPARRPWAGLKPLGPWRQSFQEPPCRGDQAQSCQADSMTAPAPRPWAGLKPSDVWRWPLPELPRRGDRLLARLAGLFALGTLSEIEGWERVHPRNDPFLLVANHSSRREVVVLMAILLLARGGRPVRFLADWNFRLIPGVGHLYDHSGAISLTRKDARPRVLNRLKPMFESAVPAYEQALRHLKRGGSLGIFPEGTVNRGGSRLLRGRRGAARLSLQAQVPVVPAGIRFARRDPRTGDVDTSSPMTIRFGEPMNLPPSPRLPPPREAVSDWHAQLMAAIAVQCGKDWSSSRDTDRPRTGLRAPETRFVEPRSGDAPC